MIEEYIPRFVRMLELEKYIPDLPVNKTQSRALAAEFSVLTSCVGIPYRMASVLELACWN
jgi:hypothetical protein